MRRPLDKDPFRKALLAWHRNHGRHHLPWRHTRDPYAILISEVMLQQTQVATVIPYYEKWLKRFPDFQALARASESQVLHAWQGLGYYSRARNLHAAAKAVARNLAGECPRQPNELRSLPGLGRYTANAVASFAFDQTVPIVDANIARVIARLFNVTSPIDTTRGREQIWRRAAELVPARQAGRFNSALMDLGATVCLPRNPQCGICPVKKTCRAQDPLRLPIKRARPKLIKLEEHHAFTIRQNKTLLQQCARRWRGMWMLPALSPGSPKSHLLHVATFPFTNHQITLRVFAVPANGTKPTQRWFSLRQLKCIPIPSPHRRAIDSLLKQS